MLKYEEFNRCIKVIEKQIKQEIKVENALGIDGVMTFTVNIIDEMIYLLSKIMNDNGNWIEYWIWELDFGTGYKEGKVLINEEPVKLKSILDLYNVLTKE